MTFIPVELFYINLGEITEKVLPLDCHKTPDWLWNTI